MPQGPPSAGVERLRRPQLDRGRQRELEERIGEERREPRRDRHPGQPEQERDRQDRRDDQATTQRREVSGGGDVSLRAFGGDVLDGRLASVANRALGARLVAGRLDGRAESLDVDASWVEPNRGRFRREVDARSLDTVHVVEEARDPVDARGAGHPVDWERHRLD